MERRGKKAGLLRVMGTCLYCGFLKLSCRGICYAITFFSFSVVCFFYLISTFFCCLQASVELPDSLMQEAGVEKPKTKNISNESGNVLALASFSGRGQQGKTKSIY